MSRTRLRSPALAILPVVFMILAPLAHAAAPRVHAIVGARIVTAPGKVIERGTIVMRDGVITAVGAGVAVPADARVWPGDSLTVYPGLIDAYVVATEAAPAVGAQAANRRPPQPASTANGAAHPLPVVRAEVRVSEMPPPSREQLEGLRAAGFTVAQVAPREGVIRGWSAVMGLSAAAPGDAMLREDAMQVMALEPARTGYPGSLMGAVAVVRQALLDARWYRDTRAAYAKSPAGRERPELNLAWDALQPVIDGQRPALIVVDEMLEVLRAGTIAKEAGITATVVGGGDEYKRVKDIAARGTPMIVPVNFPEAPDVSDPDQALEVTTEELRHWQAAPGNPATLAQQGVPFALTTNGLKDVKAFRGNVSKAIARGLKPDDALAAVTTTPARLLGLSDRLGTLTPGKIANLTVTRGDLFSDAGAVREVWIDGARLEVAASDGAKGTWAVRWSGGKDAHTMIVATEPDTTVKLVVGADTLAATSVRLDAGRLAFTVRRGSENPEAFDLATSREGLSGTLKVAGVGSHDVTAVRLDAPARGKDGKDKKADEPPVAVPAVMGNTEAWRAPAPGKTPIVFVHGATVWTAGPQGTIENADLLVRDGKIAAVGRGLKAPSGALVIDGAGKHVAPGIIDPHSHSAVLGNVNECTNNVTSEVRIQDVINSESINIYRQLAGGTTIMHLLHGSCNSIGGQCAVIKNKWGEPPDQLLFAGAAPTIKFALGENPKQSNWGTDATDRYPKSRGGVEQSIRDAFLRAKDYRAAIAEAKKDKSKLPPRRDLQLDALVEILDGKRIIHCHSYRQDEILALMRVADELGFKVGTFTHVLEGYKVANEMAAHGAMGSSFSDWWAYKYEVIDAIPYNGYLMWDRGVTVSFNSDDSEHARRLNTEAAKAIKYGGVPPEEAIKFATLNAAKQIGADARVGSLEVGKDADFTVWDGSPLSPYSACQQTWIEGRKYFDRGEDLAAREALARERDALIARARGTKRPGRDAVASNWPPRYLDDTDTGGNDCGGEFHPFLSETERRARRAGEAGR